MRHLEKEFKPRQRLYFRQIREVLITNVFLFDLIPSNLSLTPFPSFYETIRGDMIDSIRMLRKAKLSLASYIWQVEPEDFG